jgi:hypothetical protein
MHLKIVSLVQKGWCDFTDSLTRLQLRDEQSAVSGKKTKEAEKCPLGAVQQARREGTLLVSFWPSQ